MGVVRSKWSVRVGNGGIRRARSVSHFANVTGLTRQMRARLCEDGSYLLINIVLRLPFPSAWYPFPSVSTPLLSPLSVHRPLPFRDSPICYSPLQAPRLTQARSPPRLSNSGHSSLSMYENTGISISACVTKHATDVRATTQQTQWRNNNKHVLTVWGCMVTVWGYKVTVWGYKVTVWGHALKWDNCFSHLRALKVLSNRRLKEVLTVIIAHRTYCPE
eukprot:1184777-Prorocentrum_minimum.AAC.4